MLPSAAWMMAFSSGVGSRSSLSARWAATRVHERLPHVRQHIPRRGDQAPGCAQQIGSPHELIADLHQPSYVEIAFQGAAPDAQLFSSLVGLPVDTSNAQRWSVGLIDPTADLQRMLACVTRLELPMQQLHVRRASLEDVFLHYTGHSVRD